MVSTLNVQISEDQVDSFWRDGVVCLKNAFSSEWVERLREATELVLEKGSEQHIEAEVSAGRFTVDTYVWLQYEMFRKYAMESPAAAIAARLLRAKRISLLYDQLLVKEPGADKPTSWHQDGASWPLNGESALTIWMPLDPVVRETGGMLYAKGEHLGTRYGSFVNVVKRSSAVGNDEDRCPDFTEINDGKLVLQWDVEPGDCIVHHMWMPHATGGNLSPEVRRRVHTTRWVSEGCTFREGDYQLRPLIDHGLREGDPLQGPLYPEVNFRRSWS